MRRVEQYDQIIDNAQRIQMFMVDMETGLRAYVITEQPQFLEPYENAQQLLEKCFAELGMQLKDKPVATKILEKTIAQSKVWREYAEEVKAKVGHAEEAKSLVMTGHGKEIMDQLRGSVDQLIGAETDLRKQQSQTAHVTATVVLCTSMGLCLLIGILAAYLVRRQLFAVAGT